MTGSISFTQLVLQASPMAQAVMGALMVASLASWAVILAKRGLLSRTQKSALAFENRFWSGGSLTDLYEAQRRGHEPDDGLAQIFRSGFEEYTRQQSMKSSPDDALAAVQRQMRVAMAREVEKLEGGLSLLATIGSTSPYVGLFGTVGGIINAFVAIGNVKQATLASVAPGIAEALIATAIGLFAAIPAVIAYNFFVARVERIENRYATFAEEMVGILDRSLRGGAMRGV